MFNFLNFWYVLGWSFSSNLKQRDCIFDITEIKELVLKGQSSLKSGDFEESLGYFEQALLLNQDDPDLWNFKAVALRSLGRYEEALECFNKSLKLDPRDKHASWFSFSFGFLLFLKSCDHLNGLTNKQK